MRAALHLLQRHPRAALLAVAASAAVHVAVLSGGRAPEGTAAPREPTALTLLPPPAPPTQPQALPEPAAVAAPATHTPASQTAEAATPPTAAPADAPEAPLLRLAGPAAWQYRLRQNGQDGEAELTWQPQDDGRYSLRLTRRIGERALPALESLGRTGSAGLSPERFALQRSGRDRQAVNFDTDSGLVSFSASPAQLDLPGGTQDRLSWWLQLAALVQASGADARAPGSRWRVWVAGLRGELREWTFEAVAVQAEDADLLHLRRQPLGPHDPGVELWLDPARGHWPVRLRQGDPEARGFEIRLADVKS